MKSFRSQRAVILLSFFAFFTLIPLTREALAQPAPTRPNILPSWPQPQCTPPYCPAPGKLVCGQDQCEGGCGTICKQPTVTPTPSASNTPKPQCTAVACSAPGRLVCPPNGICEGGCGMVCESANPNPQCTPVACPAPGKLICPPYKTCEGGCGMVCQQPAGTQISFRCSVSVAFGDSPTDVAFPDGRACSAQITFNNGGTLPSTKVVSCIIPRQRTACTSIVTLPYGSTNPEIAGVTAAPSNLSDDEQLQLGIISRKDYPKVSFTEKSVLIDYRYVGPSLRAQ